MVKLVRECIKMGAEIGQSCVGLLNVGVAWIGGPNVGGKLGCCLATYCF